MAYRVELTVRAKRQLNNLYLQISTDDSAEAARWFNGLEQAIDTLGQFPRRCRIAPESKKSKQEFRHLLYGSKRDVYRVIYDIDKPQKLVRVRAVRHSAMDEFKS